MPKKPHKWGIKAWALADSSNGLFYPNITLILGKTPGVTEKGLGHKVVMDLVSD